MTHKLFISGRKLNFKHVGGNGLISVRKWRRRITESLWFLWGCIACDFGWQAMRLLWLLEQYLHRDHPVSLPNYRCLFLLKVFWSSNWLLWAVAIVAACISHHGMGDFILIYLTGYVCCITDHVRAMLLFSTDRNMLVFRPRVWLL